MGVWPENPFKDEPAHIRSLRTALLIREQDVLSHVLRLPLAAEHSLHQVMPLIMERDLPLPVEQLVTDWRIQGRDTGALHVQIVAIRRTSLQSNFDLLERWDLRVNRVAIAPRTFDQVNLSQTYGNLAMSARKRAALPWTSTQKILGWGAVAAVVLAVMVTLGQWTYERVRLMAPLREAHTAQMQFSTLSHLYDRNVAPAKSLVQLLTSSDAIDVLARLTHSVGTDAWAHELAIREDPKGGFQVKFTGRAANGRELVRQLKELPTLKDVDLSSSELGEVASGKNRIALTMHWKDAT
jgi:hypothetical protein